MVGITEPSKSFTGTYIPSGFPESSTNHTRSWMETLEVASRLYKIVGEYCRTHLRNEDNLDVLLVRKRHYEKIYVELKVHDVTLWEVKEQLKASERCLMRHLEGLEG